MNGLPFSCFFRHHTGPENKKASTDRRDYLRFIVPLFIKRWFQSFDLHTHCLTNRFVCNFLSSSASLNLCSCFFWLTLVFRFPFRLSLGFHFHGLSPLPLLFLTPAVFAFFRPLQFWVLTTQPLFCLSFSSRFRLTASSPVLLFRFRFPGFPRSLLPDFSCIPSRFLYLALLFVSFRPSSLRSHSCSASAYLRFRSGIFPFFSASFRPLLFRFRLLSLLFLPFRSSRLRLTVASSVPASALASAFSPFSPA